MTTITASSTVGIILSSPSYTNPVVVNPTVTISNYYSNGTGISGSSDVWTIRSAGTIAANITSGWGVDLKYGGSVTNQSGARISGLYGVYGGYDGALSVVNAGSITGNTTTSAGNGIHILEGGSVTNQSGGMITGFDGIYGAGSALSVVNAGSITGNTTTSAGNGIYLQAGGSVTNQSGGMITGFDGIFQVASAALMVVNAGSIAGNTTAGYGIYLGVGGSVANQSGATVSGFRAIFGAASAALMVVNAGSIAGNAMSGFGIELDGGGSVTNQSGATVSGFRGVFGGGGPMTVVNAGTINGGSSSVHFAAGQSNRLVVEPGAVFSGPVEGGNTIGATWTTTLELAFGASAGTLSAIGTQFINFGSIAFDVGTDWFIAGNTSGLAGTITGFAQGDTIELNGIAVTGSSYAGGVLTLTEASGSATLDLPGSFTTNQFVVTNVAAGADVSLACFRADTRIRTMRGEVPVEQLLVGDQVEVLLGGPPAPIVWVGHRTVDCKRHPVPQRVWPVRVCAGTFGPGLPLRDLFLSPDHAIFIEDVLIPIKQLINGHSIVQVPVDEVTWYHVELAQHDVLLAEGLPAESYLDTGNRGSFSNGGVPERLYPDFCECVREAHGCAPLIMTGPRVAVVRHRVAVRATAVDTSVAA